MTDGRAKRLDKAAEGRRLELGKKWKDVAAEATTSYQTLNVWRKTTRPVDPLTDHKISRALGWAPGSREAILNGGDPTLMPAVHAEPEQPTPEPETDVIGRVLDAAMAGLTPRQKLIYLEKYGDGVRREMEETEREHRDAG